MSDWGIAKNRDYVKEMAVSLVKGHSGGRYRTGYLDFTEAMKIQMETVKLYYLEMKEDRK